MTVDTYGKKFLPTSSVWSVTFRIMCHFYYNRAGRIEGIYREEGVIAPSVLWGHPRASSHGRLHLYTMVLQDRVPQECRRSLRSIPWWGFSYPMVPVQMLVFVLAYAGNACVVGSPNRDGNP